MKKGKFGIILCFYPIAAFAAVILNSPMICAALAALTIFAERDEWAGRQTLQACMLSAVLFFFDRFAGWGVSALRIPFFSTILSVVSSIFFAIAYLAAIAASILGILRVSRDGEANIPLFSSLAYRIYGKVKPRPVQPVTYAAPYEYPPQPQPPQPQTAAPYPPQPQYPQQYTPPVNVPPQQNNGSNGPNSF